MRGLVTLRKNRAPARFFYGVIVRQSRPNACVTGGFNLRDYLSISDGGKSKRDVDVWTSINSPSKYTEVDVTVTI